MVTQNNQSGQTLRDEAEDLDNFNIVDSTGSDQLELESHLDSELGVEQEPESRTSQVDGEQIPLGRDTERQAPIDSTPQASEQPEPVQPVRTFSQQEVSKMQASWMRQIREQQEAAKQARAEMDRLNLEAEVEARLRQQEAALVPQYGEEDARAMVRAQSNVGEVREQIELRHENERLKRSAQDTEQLNEQNAKSIIAQQLMGEYGLSTEDYQFLLSTGSPQAMVSLAQRLGTQAVVNRQKTQQRMNRVPAENQRTAVENGRSSASSVENAERRLARLRATPSYEWSDADYDFMRTGR